MIEASPISNPIHPSSTASTDTVLNGVSFLNSCATIASTGNSNSTPFAAALSNNDFANSTLSASNNDDPTFFPCAFKNVNIIPPPIITLSALSNKFSITPILSETFAPPNIATKGLAGLSTAPPMNSISFDIKNPATETGMFEEIPTFEACAL